VSIYLTALLVAAGGAAYASLEIAKRQPAGEQADAEEREPGSKAFVAQQLSLMTWGMMAGTLFFVALQALGYAVLSKRLEEDDNPLVGLWIQAGAAGLAVALGGIVSAAVAG
jgi:hypothetical protein